MSHLNGQKVYGKVMRVTLSKHQTVALPREGLDDQLLTKGKRTEHPARQLVRVLETGCYISVMASFPQPWFIFGSVRVNRSTIRAS